MGLIKRYTAHKLIQNFLQQTDLPPAGVLQSSCSVGLRLRVDFLASRDTPLDVDGSPTTRPLDAAVDATGADGAASSAAAATQQICRRPQQKLQSLRQAGTSDAPPPLQQLPNGKQPRFLMKYGKLWKRAPQAVKECLSECINEILVQKAHLLQSWLC